LDPEAEINSAWETIRENIKISTKDSLSYFELKKLKPWFNEGCSKLVDQKKEPKLEWLQDPSEINGDNLNNVRLEASSYFRNKKRKCHHSKYLHPYGCSYSLVSYQELGCSL
jgi:hypothetical protein